METMTPAQAIAEELGVEIIRPGRFVDDVWTVNEDALLIGGGRYTTLNIGGVKVALCSTDIYIHNNSVYYADPSAPLTDAVVIAGVVTPPAERRKGFATLAMHELCYAATRAGITLKLEPCPISSQRVKGERLPTANQLRKFYARFGFVGGQIMERKP